MTIRFKVEVHSTERRISSGGAWVSGEVAGHQFQALVFAQHATVASYELRESRISKLSLRRLSDSCIVFEWERGLHIPAENAETLEILDHLLEFIPEWTDQALGW